MNIANKLKILIGSQTNLVICFILLEQVPKAIWALLQSQANLCNIGSIHNKHLNNIVMSLKGEKVKFQWKKEV